MEEVVLTPEQDSLVYPVKHERDDSLVGRGHVLYRTLHVVEVSLSHAEGCYLLWYGALLVPCTACTAVVQSLFVPS